MTIKTSIGFEFECEPEKVLDYEFSYLIGVLQTDTPEEQIKDNALLLNKMLGSKEEVLRFFAYVKEKNGVIDKDVVTNFTKEALELMKADKKK